MNEKPAKTPDAAAISKDLLARRRHLLGPAYRLFYDEPLHLVRGEGVWVYDAGGNRYLDAYNNVASVGHCHPRIVEAIHRQATRLNTHTRYAHETILEYADRLLATMPRALGHVMYTCSGSEANDLAIRVAEACTGGTGIIVTRNAYHGVSHAVSRMSPSLGPRVPLGPQVWTVAGPRSEQGARTGPEFAEGVRAALGEMRERGVNPAAMFCDTVFSSDGIHCNPRGFLADAVDLVQRAGALFVADEVQAGFGRTGDAMWGFERHGVIPDLVTLGKPMGNGHPVAAMVARPATIARFGDDARYFNTFGGNPVSCAAALATLSVIQDEALRENARNVGDYLRRSLAEAAPEAAAEIRGAGLFTGVEIVSEDGSPDPLRTTAVVNGLRRKNVLIGATGPQGNVLKIRPPLILGREHADMIVSLLAEELKRARPEPTQRRGKVK